MSQALANQQRRLLDGSHIKTQALPAANASNAAASIDLGSPTLGPVADDLEFEVSVEALPSLANATTVTVTIADSADNSTFAAIPSLATLVLTGAGGVGAAAASRRYKLPPTTRQFVRVQAAVLTGAGDNTAKSYSAKLFANR